MNAAVRRSRSPSATSGAVVCPIADATALSIAAMWITSSRTVSPLNVRASSASSGSESTSASKRAVSLR
jgi:hypothetical protein